MSELNFFTFFMLLQQPFVLQVLVCKPEQCTSSNGWAQLGVKNVRENNQDINNIDICENQLARKRD